MCYGRSAKPTFLFNHSFSNSASELYQNSLYEYDPLYLTVRNGLSIRVLTLRSAARQSKLSRYRAALLQHAQIADELAIVLPFAEDYFIAICFDQATGSFDTNAVALAEAIYPVIHEANRLHLDRVWADAGPTRCATPQSRRREPAFMEVRLRQVFDNFCKLYRLSARECALLTLAKEGLANRSIAARLSLAVGTVKNYKRRLYRKLGVCTERAMLCELGAFMARESIHT